MQLLETYYFELEELEKIPIELFMYNTIFESAENVDFICRGINKYNEFYNKTKFQYDERKLNDYASVRFFETYKLKETIVPSIPKAILNNHAWL